MFEKNPLDVLFKDIKRQLYLEDQAKAKAQAQGRVHVPKRQSTYANPLNWTPGKAVLLIHATEGSIGVFREYFHKFSPSARRLLPAPPGTPVDRNELVFGEWWLHPKFSAPVEPDSEAELRALTARFNELMDLEDELE
jgi:hypothetical protein